MLQSIKSRISSDRGDGTSVSNILWIVFATVLSLTIGAMLYRVIHAKATKVKDCIERSNATFSATGSSSSTAACQ